MPDPISRHDDPAPNPVLGALGRVLEAALNRVVALDPDTQARIAALEGRALALDFGNGLPAMRLAVEGGHLRIGPAAGGASALRVSATPGAWLRLALARGRDDALAPGRVEISGDAELARRLERIARHFAPDFDEAFARVFGDFAGLRLARGVRDGLAWTRDSARSLARDGADYLTEESRDLVARAELDEFLDAVDRLRERGERLDARVRQLLARHGNPAA